MLTLFLFQLIGGPSYEYTESRIVLPSSDPIITFYYILAFAIPIIIAILYIIRAIWHAIDKENKAFEQIVLEITVPRERKMEGAQNAHLSANDRLEYIREEIGIAETLFSTLAGTKPQKASFSSLFVV